MTNKAKPPIFCEKICPVCRGARAGNRVARAIQRLELKVFGPQGCWWGRARYRYYGVTPDQPIPEGWQAVIKSKGGIMKLESSAFSEGGVIPAKYTKDGDNCSPPLSWSGAPAGTKSFALAVTDPDAPVPPGVTFVHWMACDIPATVTSLSEAASPGGAMPSGTKELNNSFVAFGVPGYGASYGGLWPPAKHKYVFTLYALKAANLGLAADADYNAFTQAVDAQALEKTTLSGYYGPAKTPQLGG